MNICLLGCSFYSLSQRNRGALRLGITVGRKVKGIYIIQIMDDLMCLDFIVQMAAWRGVDNLYGWHYQGVISRIRDFRLDKIAFQGFNLLTELHCDELPLVVSILNTCHQSEGIINEAIVVCLIDPQDPLSLPLPYYTQQIFRESFPKIFLLANLQFIRLGPDVSICWFK